MEIPGVREKPPEDVSCDKDPAAIARSVLSKNGISVPATGADPLGNSSDIQESIKVDSTTQPCHAPSYKNSLMGIHGSELNGASQGKSSSEANDMLPDIFNQTWELPEPSDDMKLLMDIYPSMHISQEELNRWSKPWNASLVITILGAKVNFFRLKEHLFKIWQSNSFDLIDLPNNYYVVKFIDQANCELLYKKILFGGPWTVAQHSILVQRWSPFFDPLKNPLGRVATWVRIPNVPLLCYNKECLWRMGNMIGKTIKVDMNTMENPDDRDTTIHRGRYARLCVEIDLQKKLVSKIITAANIFNIEYEGLGLICFACGRYGHRREHCNFLIKPDGLAAVESSSSEKAKATVQNLNSSQIPSSSSKLPPEQPPPTKDQIFGPWMLVRKPARAHPPRTSASRNRVGVQIHAGAAQGMVDGSMSQSRFVVLSDSEHVEGVTSHQVSNVVTGAELNHRSDAIPMAEGSLRKGNRSSFSQHSRSKGVHVGRKTWTAKKHVGIDKPNTSASREGKDEVSNLSPNVPLPPPNLKPKKGIKNRTHNLVRGSLEKWAEHKKGPMEDDANLNAGRSEGLEGVGQTSLTNANSDLNHSSASFNSDLLRVEPTSDVSDLNHSSVLINYDQQKVEPTPISVVIPSESELRESNNFLENVNMSLTPLIPSSPNQELHDHGSELRSVSQLEVVVLMEEKPPDK